MTVDASFFDWVSGSAMLNCDDPAIVRKKSGDSQRLIKMQMPPRILT